MYVTVLYSYKKHCRIVRFSNEITMMHALDGLFLSLMHNNVTRVDFLIFHTPHFTLLNFHTPDVLHCAFSTLPIFYTPHFPHSTFSTLLIFHTPHFLHSALRTPRFPPNHVPNLLDSFMYVKGVQTRLMKSSKNKHFLERINCHLH